MTDSISTMVARAKALISTTNEAENRELGWIINDLANVLQRDPNTQFGDDAVYYKTKRLLQSRIQSTTARHSPDAVAGKSDVVAAGA